MIDLTKHPESEASETVRVRHQAILTIKKIRVRAIVRREHVECNEGVKVVKVTTHPTIKKCTRHKQIKHYRACPESANELRRMSD